MPNEEKWTHFYLPPDYYSSHPVCLSLEICNSRELKTKEMAPSCNISDHSGNSKNIPHYFVLHYYVNAGWSQLGQCLGENDFHNQTHGL